MQHILFQIRRLLGIGVVPVALLLVFIFSESFETAALVALVSGFACGCLLRSWGSVLLVPAEAYAICLLLVHVIDAREIANLGGDPFAPGLIVAIHFVVVGIPATVGAVIGTAFAQRQETAPQTWRRPID